MLVALSIRDIVLIDELDMDLRAGLTVLTGETGAGKSILLDALGLATGARADKSLVRAGADQGSASALFEVPLSHPCIALLTDHGVDIDSTNSACEVLLRRIQSNDGRSRAFICDVPVSVSLLREVGASLLEVHGQHDDRGLLNASSHRALLDVFGGYKKDLNAVRATYERWQEAVRLLDETRLGIAEARAQADYYAHVLEELRQLDPQSGEEAELAQKRTLMMHAEKIVDDLDAAKREFDGGKGLISRLSSALRRLEQSKDKAGEHLDAAIAALDRTLSEAAEAQSELSAAILSFEFNPSELEQSEERLFALRAVARKHSVQSEDLPTLLEDIAKRLETAEMGVERLDELEREVEEACASYVTLAQELHQKRVKAAGKLDGVISRELGPLKLDKAMFKTVVKELDVENARPDGLDQIVFHVSTNPGTPLGPMIQIASGGELARFILALKVALATKGSSATLIFDEVDQGVGGAVAAAVGERLARLAGEAQILVVTHSPQVAARASHHWKIEKAERERKGKTTGRETVTNVSELVEVHRREEIARMLAGALVTEEARAAADQLIAGSGR